MAPTRSTFSLLLLLHSVLPSHSFIAKGVDAFQYTPLIISTHRREDLEYPNHKMSQNLHNSSFYYHGWPSELGEELNPFFRYLYQTAEDGQQGDNHRQKRFVRLIPPDSLFLTKYTFNIPASRVKSFKSSYNFDLYVYFSFPTFIKGRRKRDLSSPDRGDPQFRRKQREEEKMNLFSQVESILDEIGLPARSCVLRLLCDLAEAPIVNGLFGDLINSLLRPSFHPNDLIESAKLNDVSDFFRPFLEAERHGRIKGNCESKYTDCACSLSDVFPVIENMIF